MTDSSPVLPYESTDPSAGTSVAERYTLLGLLGVAATIAYVQRSGIAVAAHAIQGDLGLDKIAFGAVLSAWSLGYALMQIPSGWLADRWGSRRALAFYAVCWSLATGAMSQARGYHSLLVLWTLMGAAQAGIFPCSTKAISQWFRSERRASATGLLGACMGIGGAVAPILTAVLMAGPFTWRMIFVLYAIPGILWAVAFLLIARDRLRVVDVAATPDFSAAQVWGRLIGSGSLWLLCTQQFLRAAAMIFFVTWFPTFLRESRGATIVQSGYLTALAGAGAVLGSVLGGLASDKVLLITGSQRLSRQGIAVLGMTACAVLIVCAYYIFNTTLAVCVISAGAFCGTFGGVSGYTVAMDFGGKRVATVFSVMNMCGNFGAALFPLVIGWIVQASGNWDLVLFIFAGIFAVDAVCWALLNPKEPLFAER